MYQKVKSLLLLLILLATLGKASATHNLAASAALTCSAPVNLQFNYVNGVTQFSWDAVAGASSYIIEYKLPGYTWDYIEYADTLYTNFYAPAFNIQSWTVDWRVIAVCASGQAISADASFTVPCPEPLNLAATSITTTSALLTWTPAPGYDPVFSTFVAAYRPLGSSIWISLGYTDGSSLPLTGLLPNTTYEWCANQVCGYEDSPPVVRQFTTLPLPCGVPPILNTLTIGIQSATLNWTSVSGTNTYTIQYRALGAANWITLANVVNTTYPLTGLSLNTSYEFRVSAICNGIQGAYSHSHTFTTNCIQLNSTAEWIDYFRIGSLLRVSGAEPSGYSYINTPTPNLLIGSSYQTQFSAGFNGGTRPQSLAYYLDSNRNGIFELSERIYGVGMVSVASTRHITITIPATATPGNTRLRVVMLRQGQSGVSMSPCPPVGIFGEVEDYLVNLVAPPPSLLATHEQTSPQNSALELAHASPNPSILYPNPSSGQFNVYAPRAVVAFEVFNSLGQLVQGQAYTDPIYELAISLHAAGMYYVKITDKDGNTDVHKVHISL